MEEQQIILNKQERERAKVIKAQESSIIKEYHETKKRKSQNKKELKKEMQLLKKAIKSENSKENLVRLHEKLKIINAQLTELENSMIEGEIEFLETKIKIKQETV